MLCPWLFHDPSMHMLLSWYYLDYLDVFQQNRTKLAQYRFFSNDHKDEAQVQIHEKSLSELILSNALHHVVKCGERKNIGWETGGEIKHF